MKIKEHECSIEDCDSDVESQSMRLGNSLEESIESKLMWEAIRKYLPKLELKECEVMIALYIDRLSVTATAAKLKVDASTVRRRRDSACDKIRKAIVLPQIVSIKQASRMLGLPPYYLRRLCKEVPGVAFQSGIKWYINLGKLVDYYNNAGRITAG